MQRIKKDPTLQMKIHQYLVSGRKLKTEIKESKIYSMKVFAKISVIAKSKFWKQMKNQNKLKPSQGEILPVNELFEKNHKVVRTYGLVIKYHSRSGIHNFQKEFRDVSICGAVFQMYMHMAGNHRTLEDTIKIVRSAVVQKSNDIKRPIFVEIIIKIPNCQNPSGATEKKYRCIFKANRPNLYKSA